MTIDTYPNMRATAALPVSAIEAGRVGAKITPELRLAATLCWLVCASPAQAADYQVGSGQTFDSIAAVPWPSLTAGDTVRIHWRAEPYREKILISNSGTAERPIRII